jgi:hypothetical protein
MPKLGEALHINPDLLSLAARRQRITEAGGGLAVIRTFIEDDPLAPPWLVGLASGEDGSSEYAWHRILKVPGHTCDTSLECKGAAGSPGGLVVATTGTEDFMLSVRNRLDMLIDMAGRGQDPSHDVASLALLREFYVKGHQFDPGVYPMLHAAMEETVYMRSSEG